MVQLVEVEDEHFQQRQAGPEEEDGDFTDTGKSFPVVSYAWNEGHASCSDAIAKKIKKILEMRATSLHLASSITILTAD